MILKEYYPIPRFPPISISGSRCILQCRHCAGVYLKGMMPAETPEKLLLECHKLNKKNAVGFLLSGGSDNNGRMLNLTKMLEALHRIKQETNLIINIHPGLISKEIGQELSVDFASLEIPSDTVIRNVFGLNATSRDYIKTYHNLTDAGITVIPHICIYSGEESNLLHDLNESSTIVVIVFTPTRHTPMSCEKAPEVKVIGRTIRNIHEMFPETEISLGCMRPRNSLVREEIEIEALVSGISRIEMPSRRTSNYAIKLGYEIRKFDACCALPVKYEVISSSISG
jgi:lipoyl synthase